MDNHDDLLAEFYFYTVGDKTVYNQELNDLFVCYTVARGLQIPCDCPRRPPLPLELILRILRFAGFIEPKPDMTLSCDAFIYTKNFSNGGASSTELYITERLTRVQLASMARLQLVKTPRAHDAVYYDRHNLTPHKWAFIPLGRQDEKFGFPNGSRGIVASLFPCRDETEVEAVVTLNDDVVTSDMFPPDHAIGKQLDQGEFPCVVVVSRERARLFVWRWWEPKF